MILHIMTREKFTQPFIDFINEHFDSKEHQFIVLNKNTDNYALNLELDNVHEIKGYDLGVVKLLYFLNKSNKIILHGLNSSIITMLLFFQFWLLKKTYWVIWGADLYNYKNPKLTYKSKLYEFIKATSIRNFHSIIAYASGDYDYAKQWYQTKANFIQCLYYPYLAVSDYLKGIELNHKQENLIMVGNSSDPSNEHLEVFEKLRKINNIHQYKILCPLSYGNKENAKKVIEKGKILFKGSFIPLVDFMKEDEYYQLLSKVNIVIMAHKRQQATGNILALVKFGKKIFIRKNISTWKFYKENSIKLFDYNKIETELLIPFQNNEVKNNQKAIKDNFTIERVIQEWKKILNDNHNQTV